MIEADVEIAADVTIEPGTSLRGATTIGPDSAVGPHTTATDARIGSNSHVLRSHLSTARSATSAPSARSATRPGARLHTGAAGRLPSSASRTRDRRGEGAHLSYVGDSGRRRIQPRGLRRSPPTTTDTQSTVRRFVERELRQVNSLVAPVIVGDGAYTGAGAVIRKDVLDGALGVTDADQRNIEGYAESRPRRLKGTSGARR